MAVKARVGRLLSKRLSADIVVGWTVRTVGRLYGFCTKDTVAAVTLSRFRSDHSRLQLLACWSTRGERPRNMVMAKKHR